MVNLDTNWPQDKKKTKVIIICFGTAVGKP